ncbi:GL10159 [Drosophila persimilis]|uniref:Uncharacterized protein hng1 n=2 Tax=pseudoobscura subgroup TaxID=32358 RepID=A0A6I8UWC5_DROPS|nr:uncharacterized protein LOC4805541 [Drosophila pseudoobscura]XP_002025883.1 uncharacterized protein LOC6600816 [Drosophila persimilis]EDW32790.1 GL10159 [Drosophila persimilis]
MSSNHRPLDASDIQLIQTIRETPSLYDPQLPSFRLSQRKEEDWLKVAETLRISTVDARRRWTCLRDRYSRELKQMRLHPTSEFGRNDFFKQMDFLRQFVRKRRERNRRDQTPTGWLKVDMRRNKLMKMSTETETLIEDSHVYEETDEHNYDTKLEVQTSHSETYSVLVEADDGQEPEQESFEEDFIGDGECEHKTMDSTTTTSPHADDAAHPTQGDINYMVCMPSMSQERKHLSQESLAPTMAVPTMTETEDDYFCKSVAAYLRQLSRVHKIKAKVEMFQILEKYIMLEEERRGVVSGSRPGSG